MPDAIEKVTRTKLINIRVTEEEFDNFSQWCRTNNTDMSNAVRAQFCNQPRRKRPPPPEKMAAEVALVSQEIGKVLHEVSGIRRVAELEGSVECLTLLDRHTEEWSDAARAALQVLRLP